MLREPLLQVLLVSIALFSCKKEDVSPPGPSMNETLPLCIGAWNVDSTYVPSSDEYYPVIPKIYTFSSNGTVTINSLGGIQGTWSYHVVQESIIATPSELGRTLIWATTDSNPANALVILMIHQSATEGFLLITTTLDHGSPWDSLTNVHEDMTVSENPVFPSWAKFNSQ